MFVIIAICQDAPFCHVYVNFCQPFDSFLPNSPSFAKFVIVLKIANYQQTPFCHLIWIFGQTLDEFLAHSPYLSKSVFCQYSPLCHLIWGFNQIVGGFLLSSPFSHICHFCEKRQLSIWLSCSLAVSILAKFAGTFRQICHFRKITICQDASFCYLIRIFGQTLDEFLGHSPFCRNLPFSPKFAIFLL